jgi:hypothetical protein
MSTVCGNLKEIRQSRVSYEPVMILSIVLV